jgi:hypothetical protein
MQMATSKVENSAQVFVLLSEVCPWGDITHNGTILLVNDFTYKTK